MRWRKRGLLVPASPEPAWAVSHAMVPVVDVLDGGRIRVYFTSRDGANRSQIGYVDFDDFPGGSRRYSAAPVLGPGALGSFDDSGAMSSGLVHHGGRIFLYYIGWMRGVTVPFYTFTGCAISDDGGATFERVAPAPVLYRSGVDPYLAASPWALAEDGRFRLWYASGTKWEIVDGAPKHWYHVKYAESADGIAWDRRGHVCIDFRGDEYAIARPYVLHDDGRYRMWYSYRGDAYRIGYAESPDGLEWLRRDAEAGIDVSDSGWDSEMIEYPCVFDHGGERYLLYNGNGYGASGIGYAVLEDE